MKGKFFFYSVLVLISTVMTMTGCSKKAEEKGKINISIACTYALSYSLEP